MVVLDANCRTNSSKNRQTYMVIYRVAELLKLRKMYNIIISIY